MKLALPFAVAGALLAYRKRQLLPALCWLGAAQLLLLATLLTASRGALLGLLAALVVMWALPVVVE